MARLSVSVQWVLGAALGGSLLLGACDGGDGDDSSMGGTGGTSTSTGGTGTSTGGATTTGGTSNTGGSGTVGECDGLGTSGGEIALIDDLEHEDSAEIIEQDGRKGSWFASNDGTVGSTQTPPGATAYPTADVGVDDSFGFASAGSGFETWGANFGITLNAQGTKGCGFDASSFDGFEFWAISGDGEEHEIVVKFPVLGIIPVARGGNCEGEGCDDAHGVTLGDANDGQPTVGATWQKFTILWEDLHQDEGWTHDNKFDFDPADLAQITWGVTAAVGAYDVVIDDVAFIGGDGNGAGGEGGGGS